MINDKESPPLSIGLSSADERFLERLGQAVDALPIPPIDLKEIARQAGQDH